MDRSQAIQIVGKAVDEGNATTMVRQIMYVPERAQSKMGLVAPSPLERT